MANRRSKSSKGGLIGGVVALLVVCALVFAFCKYNGIDSFQSGYDFFRKWSDKASYCADYAAKHNGSLPSDCTKADIDTSKVGNGDKDSSNASTANTNEFEKQLNTLKIAGPTNANYSRSDWKHWSIKEGSCNTREVALSQQGKDVVKQGCKIKSGKWQDLYSNGYPIVTSPKSLDLDHVVPLNWANNHGGSDWDAAKKEQFANDLSQLLVVSAKENRSKGASGPKDYMPPNSDFQCKYAQIWISTTTKYGLWIEQGDKVVLEKALKTCK